MGRRRRRWPEITYTAIEYSILSLQPLRRRCPIEIFGNTHGLAPSDTRAIERIFRRRVPPERITSPELARSLVDASFATGRQVGVLIHRSGNIEHVIVGDATKLTLPDIGRLRAASGRFRALRLVHTHLRGEPLTHDDLVDLSRLRLDLVAAIQCQPDGSVGAIRFAHMLPENPSGALWREEGPVGVHALDTDFLALMRALEQEFSRVSRARAHSPEGTIEGAGRERAILVHVADKRHAAHITNSLSELRELARAAGTSVLDAVTQVREQLDPRYVLGRGKLEDVVFRAMQLDADVLIFDRDLSPAQASSIAQLTELKVKDRTQLILDIFAQRAQSRDGKLQVELAQLKYMLPRLGQRDDSLSRLSGGIGGRGPGETRIEIAGRRSRDRIGHLEQQLRELASQRRQRRARRIKVGVPIVALIGYTNAGKSTLMNTLTSAGVLAEDKLFATLDPRSRRLSLAAPRASSGLIWQHGSTVVTTDPTPNGPPLEVILTDTVGFIRALPKDLVAAFRSTFEETADADLLLHVVDASDHRIDDQIATTEALLGELDLANIPRLMVYNKLDRCPPGVAHCMARSAGGLAIDARSLSTLAPLLARVRSLLDAPLSQRRELSLTRLARTA